MEAIVADRGSPQNHVWRCRIVLLTDAGLGTSAIMREAGVAKTAVWRWQERYMQEGVDGLLRDKTRPPGKPPLPTDVVDEVVALTQTEPPDETTHWMAPPMAAAMGISISSVQRIWKAHGLAPHRFRRFKLSNDPLLPPNCATSSASTSTRRRTPSCCRSTRRAMCGRPLWCKRKVMLRGRVAAMCPAC